MDCQATWFLTATPCGSAFVVDTGRRFGSISTYSSVAIQNRPPRPAPKHRKPLPDMILGWNFWTKLGLVQGLVTPRYAVAIP